MTFSNNYFLIKNCSDNKEGHPKSGPIGAEGISGGHLGI
jgi:hypothetical protein